MLEFTDGFGGERITPGIFVDIGGVFGAAAAACDAAAAAPAAALAAFIAADACGFFPLGVAARVARSFGRS